MRMKLIAAVVASLFASGSRSGGRRLFRRFRVARLRHARRSRHQHGRRHAQRRVRHVVRHADALSRAPKDVAKAQEYQDTQSGVIGVIDLMRRQPRLLPARLRRELRPGRPVHRRVGGGYDVVQGADLPDSMPHNLSWNALTPLQNSGTGAHARTRARRLPAGARYPATGTRSTTASSATRSAATSRCRRAVAVLRPRRLQRSHDDRHTAGERPARHRLGQRPDRVRHAHRLHDARTRRSRRATRRRRGTSSSRTSTASSATACRTTQWTNFYMRSGLDTSLLPPDNDLQEVDAFAACGATCRGIRRSLPRCTQSKLTNSIDVMGGGLKPTSNAVAADRRRLSGHGAELVDVRRRHQDDDGHDRRQLGAARRASTRGSTTTTTTSRTTRRRSRTRPAGCRRPTRCGSAAARRSSASPRSRRPENFEYTKNEVGLDLNYRIDARQKILGSTTTCRGRARSSSRPRSPTIQRAWIEYRNTKWAN